MRTEDLLAIRREGVNACQRDHAVLSQQYYAHCDVLAEQERQAAVQQHNELQTCQQLQEDLNVTRVLVQRAFAACQAPGDLEPIRAVFERGSYAWAWFRRLSGLSIAITRNLVPVVELLLEKGLDYQNIVTNDIALCQIVFTRTIVNAAQQSICDAMKNRVLKDFLESSKTGNFLWFHRLLDRNFAPQRVVLSQLINAPIPNSEGLTPMMVLARDNHLGTLIYITDQINERCTIDFLKTDNAGKTVFDHAFEWGHKTLIEWIITQTAGRGRQLSHLETACKDGDLATVQRLLQGGANPTEKNNTPLIWSCLYGNTAVVNHLLSLEAVRLQIHARNHAAIVIAARFGFVEIVRSLVDNGAPFRARENMPLALATAGEHQDVIAYLREKQNALDMPLLGAVFRNDRPMVENMLANGANINAVEMQETHSNPLQLAIVCGYVELAEFLATQSGINFSYKAMGHLNMTALEMAIAAGLQQLAERIRP